MGAGDIYGHLMSLKDLFYDYFNPIGRLYGAWFKDMWILVFWNKTHVLIRCFKNVLTALMKTKNLVLGKKKFSTTNREEKNRNSVPNWRDF